MLARQVDIDLEEVQELKVSFDIFDKLGSGLLDKSGFRSLIRSAFLVDKKDDVPETLLDDRWFELQSQATPIHTIDFEGFLRWYQANLFVEHLVMNSSTRVVRDLARRHGLAFDNVDRIHKVFVQFDEDSSLTIEFSEFRRLVCRLLGAEEETEISEVMFRHLWSEAAVQTEAIDFEMFLLWYTGHFGEDERTGQGASLLREYYRSLRPRAMFATAL